MRSCHRAGQVGATAALEYLLSALKVIAMHEFIVLQQFLRASAPPHIASTNHQTVQAEAESSQRLESMQKLGLCLESNCIKVAVQQTDAQQRLAVSTAHQRTSSRWQVCFAR